MTTTAYILVILSVALSLLCLYAASNANKKYSRLRKRYDSLLHGRGDLSLEELIWQLNEDLDQFKHDKKQTDMIIQDMRNWLGSKQEDQGNIFEQQVNSINREAQVQINNLKNRLISSMKRLDEQVYAQMDSVESRMIDFTKQNISEMRTQVDSMQDELAERIKNMEDRNYMMTQDLQNNLESKNKEVNSTLDEMVSQMNGELSAAETRINEKMTSAQNFIDQTTQQFETDIKERMEASEKHNTDFVRSSQDMVERTMAETKNMVLTHMQETQENLDSRMEELNKRLSHNYSYALQRVSLYRYNAFEGLSGEMSFSCALLNERKNGFIISSIYSRQGSSTFAKTVKDGECLQKLSPEENKALQDALTERE